MKGLLLEDVEALA
ncbi:hypothetical protein CGLO_06871 [Colletotrichum gloeosporioides Cg-14]|uniref:Uncharacterized protein n=1 Tax=Colletotrichum gloeosporioides (strain Cg-14) TaxID=1237896 RepID=T0LY19_COLGC|nr:hypothetical protein CGLO_06871 [Colletotrichum gloeosporioides Cg-14]